MVRNLPSRTDLRAGEVTAAVDVYGLGIVLLELLAGRPVVDDRSTPFVNLTLLAEDCFAKFGGGGGGGGSSAEAIAGELVDRLIALDDRRPYSAEGSAPPPPPAWSTRHWPREVAVSFARVAAASLQPYRQLRPSSSEVLRMLRDATRLADATRPANGAGGGGK